MKISQRTKFTYLVFACLSAALVLYSPSLSMAVPANPTSRIEVQPDGNSITLHQRGDEFQNWTELAGTGYTVFHNKDTKFWEYAEKAADGSLKGSGVRAIRDAGNVPSHTQKRIKPHRDVEHEKIMQEMQLNIYKQRQSQAQAQATSIALSSSSPPSSLGGETAASAVWNATPVAGEKKLLIILVNFANRSFTTPTQSWRDKVFDETAKSVSKYYKENSYNKISITPVAHTQPGTPSGIISVSISDNHPNYGGSSTFTIDRTIGNHALQQASSYVNFNSYDTNADGKLSTSEVVIYFIYAGYETAAGSGLTPSAWAHAWGTSGTGLTAGTKNVQHWGLNGELYDNTNAMGIGVIAHELGHQFCGLPDLYDTTSTNAGIGAFSLMASGSWGANSGELSSVTPTALDAWSREFLGWVSPATPVIGTMSLVAPLASSTGVIKLTVPATSTTEYFLAENRYPSGWDLGLKSFLGSSWPGGLLLLHIDNNIGTPANNDINKYVAGSHQGVMPVQANTSSCNMVTTSCAGSSQTLFYASNNRIWSDTSTVNSRYYNGYSTGFSLASISAPSAAMSAIFSDGSTPIVIFTAPSAGASSVYASSTVTAIFSQPMNPATINNSTFTLSGGITGSVIYDAVSRNATLTPSTSLSLNSTYIATIDGVANAAGTPMATKKNWSFTTQAPLSLPATELLNGLTGVAYSQSVTASGGIPPYAWSIEFNSLPAGLAINVSTGLVSGTPSQPGVFLLTMRVTDSIDSSVIQPLAITINSSVCSKSPLRISGSTPVQYPDLASAYLQATNNSTLQIQALNFTGGMTLDRDIIITLAGGYGCDYSTNSSVTGVIGPFIVKAGTAKVSNLRIMPTMP